jgi:hypothetical protein
VDYEELKSCSVCGTTLLKFVDFNGRQPTQLICCNCRKIEVRDKSIINASILEYQEQQQPIYTSNGTTFLNENKSLNNNNKLIPQVDINRQQDIKAIAAALDNSVLPSINITTTIPQNTNIQTTTAIKPVYGKIIIDWSPVIGYEEIKHILDAIINNQSKKKTHTLIAGAPGTSKTVFLKTIETSLKKQNINVHYLDATTLSSSGVVQYLFDNDVQYCLLDEIDKLEKEHQKVFLNLLESGILQETKFSIGKNKNERIRKKECKDMIVIATANYIERIMKPLKTRFLPLNIPAYTKQQFYDIGVQLLTQQYKKSKEIAYYIVNQVWEIYAIKQKKPPNLRQAVQVATLTDNTKSSIDPILAGLEKYSEEYEE